MTHLLEIVVFNALTASALAIAAAGVARWRKSPALAHALWLLVLVKLVTPPLVPIALPMAGAAGGGGVATAGTSAWTAVVAAAWGAGAVALLCLAASRLRAFRVLVRLAEPAAPALQAEADHLARRLGLPRAPRVSVVSARIPPMATATRVVLPAGLLRVLDPASRSTILAHELAHLRRRDHWLRWFELLVVAAFWWLPVAWWARSRLREAEEQCCDAWALWAVPGSSRAHAEALLATVGFLSGERAAPAPLASGFGAATQLKRRIRMILAGNTHARRLSLSAAALLLFVLPFSLAQAERPPADADRIVAVSVEQVGIPTPRAARRPEPDGDRLVIVSIETTCYPTR